MPDDNLEARVFSEDKIENGFINFMRKTSFERRANQQESDLYCTGCKINLPYDAMTVVKPTDYEEMNPKWKQQYYCPMCEDTFYKN